VKAGLLFHQRIDYDDGAIVEMVIWRDHRHFLGTESAYQFTTPKQLMADFWADVGTLRSTR
jgi:hypothetical protein